MVQFQLSYEEVELSVPSLSEGLYRKPLGCPVKTFSFVLLSKIIYPLHIQRGKAFRVRYSTDKSKSMAQIKVKCDIMPQKIHFCWIIMLILRVHISFFKQRILSGDKIRRESSAAERLSVFQNKQNDCCTLIRMSAILPDAYLSPSVVSTYVLYHVHESDACILTHSFDWMHPNSVCRPWWSK